MLPLGKLACTAVAVILLSATAFGATAAPRFIQGQSLANASRVSIDPQDGSKLTVVVFLSAHCPCSMSHEAGLSALASEFSASARFVGVHSNSDETVIESAEHFKRSALPFPVIQDEGSRLADAFGALKTPHVYVLAKNGDILFQGGIDDSHDAAKASKFYLKSALQSLREGRTPEVTLARSLGCKIRR